MRANAVAPSQADEVRLLPGFDPEVVVHPAAIELFHAMALTSADAFLAIPGEIVSGHPDRHVMRVVLADGRAAFLKREHCIRWKDRFKNWRAGFGWTSKSVREGRNLRKLEWHGLPGPRWLAYGEDRKGRAFVLLQEAEGAVDLRRAWPDIAAPDALAIRLGRLCAELHEAGVDHPDWWAKHFLVNPIDHAITVIDWPNATFGGPVPWPRRIRALAALRATLAHPSDHLAARFLWAYMRVVRGCHGAGAPAFSTLARQIEREASRLLQRRGVREQRQPPLDAHAQRLVWLDGEALCALPEIADDLVPRAMQKMLYEPRENGLVFSLNGRSVRLETSRRRALVGRFCWWLRGKAWRSPELRKARLLFHLQRHHVDAPRLLAYGQRCAGPKAAAFLLTEATQITPLRTALQEIDEDDQHLLLERLTQSLDHLHEAGCAAGSIDAIGVRRDEHGLTIITVNPDRLTFRKYLDEGRRKVDRTRIFASMQSYCGSASAACGLACVATPQAAEKCEGPR